MTRFLLPRTERARWRDMLSSPERSHLLVAALMALLSALALPLCNNSTVATVYLVVVAVFLFRLTQSLFSVLIYAAPALLLSMFSTFLPGAAAQPLVLPAAFLALLIGGACGAFLFLHSRDLFGRRCLMLALPVVAYALAALITSDPIRALLSLLPLALAAVFALCLYFYIAHTDAVVIGTGVLLLLLSLTGIGALAYFGMLDGNPLTVFTDAVRGAINAGFAEMFELYAEAGIEMPLSDELVTLFADALINMLPALFIVACTVLCYLAWRTLLCLLIAWRTLPRLPQRIAALNVNLSTAIVFALTYVLALIGNSEAITLFGTVCQNLSLILEPVLALVGFHMLFGGGRNKKRSCLTTLLIFAVIFLLFNSILSALDLLAFVGAFNVVAARFFARKDND